MTSSPLPKQALTLGGLVRRRLREVNRSAAQLAEAVQVPSEYIDDLITGARRPPLPARTDIYPKMTSFLRLSRNDLTACASAERAAMASTDAPAPAAAVRRLVPDLREPGRAARPACCGCPCGATSLGSAPAPLEPQPVVDLDQEDVLRRPAEQRAGVAAEVDPPPRQRRLAAPRPDDIERRAGVVFPPQHRVSSQG